VLIDAAFIRKDYAAALAAVDRLDKRLGGDPYLHVFRGNAHYAKGEVEPARAAFARLVKAEPTLAAAYFPPIQLELEAKNFDAAAALMTAAERRAGVRWQDIDQKAPFAEFVKSPAYAKWAARGDAAAAPPRDARRTATAPTARKKPAATPAARHAPPPEEAPATRQAAPGEPAPGKAATRPKAAPATRKSKVPE
jgi:hypothetical protein